VTAAAYGPAWRRFRLQVFRHYGRTCLVRLDGCTGYATTVDHLDAVALHGASLPSLDRVRPACLHCNSSLGATLGNVLRKGTNPDVRPSREW
jgi:hypothetical protein